MSDEKLYKLAQQYGENARMWRQKFVGLLPEMDRRKLWKKKNFGSIFEFAAKLGGMSNEQVRLVLNMDRDFENKPKLRDYLTSGNVSINKLARVRSVANEENEEFWAEQVKKLPKAALETLVRDEKNNREESLPGQTFQPEELGLSQEMLGELMELKEKGFDLNELLEEFLQKREEEIEREKEEMANEVGQAKSTYVPVRVKRVVEKEHGHICSIDGCCKPSKELHHTQRFSLSRRHDPRYLAPLCHEHHTIAHNIDVRVQEKRRR